MKYETPELTALTPAINAIQVSKVGAGIDTPNANEPPTSAYEDWEE
jgi:hypothetical protein